MVMLYIIPFASGSTSVKNCQVETTKLVAVDQKRIPKKPPIEKDKIWKD